MTQAKTGAEKPDSVEVTQADRDAAAEQPRACRYCQGEAFAESPSLGRSHWNVVCDDCGASGPHGHDEQMAIRRWNAMTNHDIPQGPVAALAGKHYWVADHYSIPADNLCWNHAPEPNRDHLCVRELNHLGKCRFVYSPTIKPYSWKDAPDVR